MPLAEWRDVRGTVCVRASVHAHGACVEIVGFGRYIFDSEGDLVLGLPSKAVSDENFFEGFRYSVLPLLLQLRGVECLHASGVVTPLGVVALCGVSGSGKSTTASALDRLGYPLWADDAVFFNIDTSNVPISIRLPFSPRLDLEAQQVISSLPPNQARVPNGVDQERLFGVIILEREKLVKSALERLSPARAFREIIQHAQCLSLHEVQVRHRFTHNYLSLADKVRSARLKFDPNVRQLPELLDLISDYLERLGHDAESPSISAERGPEQIQKLG